MRRGPALRPAPHSRLGRPSARTHHTTFEALLRSTMQMLAALLLLMLVVAAAAAAPPATQDRMIPPEEYGDASLENFLGKAYKRGSCVPRGGSCDQSPNACCDNSACRCNLWGTNCRCQRAGLMQQWGRKK